LLPPPPFLFFLFFSSSPPSEQNHLDMETTEALIKAIKNFGGGVLLVR